MELKVWVEGIQRIVCGVTEVTTCQDVVFALAHATGKTGRFTLIERWRNNERLLAPHENPLKILMKWGEYSSDVQFILQRSDQQQQQKKDAHQQQQQQQHQTSPPSTQAQQQSQQQLLRQQQKLNQLNNNHIGANGGVTNGKHSGPTSPTSPNTNTSPIIPNGVLSTHNHINNNSNISSPPHYAHHPSNGDEQQHQHHTQQHAHAKSKLHQNNLKNSANNQLHQHAHHQQQHHHQHQLSSSSTSSDHQHRSHQHQQSNGVGALIRTGNDPSNGSSGAGPGVATAAMVKQSELNISSSAGGALERGKETRKSLNSSGSSGKTEQHHHHPQQLHHQQSQKHQAQTNQQNQNVGIVRGMVQHQQKFTHVQRHSPSSTTVALAKGGGVTTTAVSSDHSSSSNSSTSSSVSSTASSSSHASSNNTSTSSGIGGSGGSGASGTSGGHHPSHPAPQPPPVEATYASVIKKPKAHAAAPSVSNGNAPPGGNNVVGEFNAADLRSSLDRKVNGLVFSNGLNERVTQPPSTSPAGGGAGPQQSPAATSSVIVGATLKPDHQLLHHHQHGTMGRHYHQAQLPNLLGADNQQHLDTSSVSSISSSSVGGGNSSGTHPSLLNGGSSTTNSPITGISSNGALVPPPYRDPPPPRNSPLSHTLTSLSSTGSGTGSSSQGRRQEKEGTLTSTGGSSSASSTVSSLVVVGPGGPEEMLVGGSDSLPHVTGYRELMQLIKLQREKINTQQADLSKYDTEIVYLENRSREQTDQLEAIAQELSKTEQQYRQTGDQLQAYQYVEEESELVRQQEKTLKSELTLLRSKLANCETELLQCKNKIRLLMDEILVEQRKYSRQYDPNRQQLLERALMCEVDRLQVEIDLAVQSADQANKAHDKLKGEVTLLEGAIADKKKQVEKLVHEMKEVNLQSLAVVPPADEVRHLLEGESDFGSVKPGSTRRMIGSPRQLENAVPTSKNPHGVWV
ncbi:uncharacterized protein DDB_G0283357 [Anopheles marshallii]|uniref:uncharacterized protein DDB_G0283357 n=1 Tax=Anopheles marshallii TaxID=1521116 RepID=UPI00237C4CED|nr:uncharacterized protein DDB_G0283357 [Anopheles marshallii]